MKDIIEYLMENAYNEPNKSNKNEYRSSDDRSVDDDEGVDEGVDGETVSCVRYMRERKIEHEINNTTTRSQSAYIQQQHTYSNEQRYHSIPIKSTNTPANNHMNKKLESFRLVMVCDHRLSMMRCDLID